MMLRHMGPPMLPTPMNPTFMISSPEKARSAHYIRQDGWRFACSGPRCGPRARSCAASSWRRRCCWSPWRRCSSWRGTSRRCIGRGAMSPRSPPPRRSAGWPTGMPSWRCSAGRSACRSRIPPSSRATITASPTISAASSRPTSWRPRRSRRSWARSISPRTWRHWLGDPERSAALAGFAIRMLPQALAAIDQCGLRRFLAERMHTELERIEIAPLAAGLLGAITETGQHQRLLDELLGVLEKLLSNEEALKALREEDPPGAAGVVQALSRRCLSAAQDRGLDELLHRGGAGRIPTIRCASNSTAS